MTKRPVLGRRDHVMDQWDFKKWRKKLGLNQVMAGEMLGLSRGAVQYWESDLRPVPRAVELACQELLRRWKQRPEFGPVTLLYSDGPISQVDSRPSGDLILRCELYDPKLRRCKNGEGASGDSDRSENIERKMQAQKDTRPACKCRKDHCQPSCWP